MKLREHRAAKSVGISTCSFPPDFYTTRLSRGSCANCRAQIDPRYVATAHVAMTRVAIKMNRPAPLEVSFATGREDGLGRPCTLIQLATAELWVCLLPHAVHPDKTKKEMRLKFDVP